jgi:heterodisulfide reductase subunit B
MKISYYPGCTLKTTAKNFEDSALFVLKQLGVDVTEIDRWNCCGTVFSLTSDDLMHHIAPVRTLLRVQEAENDILMTLCAMCYNTLKRSNERMKKEPESLEKINALMTREEQDYKGEVKILHLLELLRDEFGFDKLSQKITKPLRGLKVASYYGCLLVRPAEVGFDDLENPTVLEDMVSKLGAEPIDFPYKTECCAAYQTVKDPQIVAERTQRILGSAGDLGADLVLVSCPLCAFNLDQRQKVTGELYPGFKNIPVLYFTQLMALAFDSPAESMGYDLHHIDPRPVLKEKGIIS